MKYLIKENIVKGLQDLEYEHNVFFDFKLQSFEKVWNPLNEKRVTKEHLKSFLEKAFIRNFLSHNLIGWCGFEKEAYSLLSREIFKIYLASHCFVGKGKIPPLTFCLDASLIYPHFSHMMSPQAFQQLLRDVLYLLDVWSFWGTFVDNTDSSDDFHFIITVFP